MNSMHEAVEKHAKRETQNIEIMSSNAKGRIELMYERAVAEQRFNRRSYAQKKRWMK